MRVYLRRAVIFGGVLIAAIGCTSVWLHHQSRQVPDFYRLATVQNVTAEAIAERQAANRRLVENVQRARDAAARQGAWSVTFSSDEVNAWLAEGYPEKFPSLSQRGLTQPRAAIEDDRLLVAARLTTRGYEFVVSCEVQIELTEQPNLLAIHLDRFRVGALPIPWNQLKDRIDREAVRSGIDLQWDESEDGPVALLTIPTAYPGFPAKPVIVESIRLSGGKIELSGRSGRQAKNSYQPRGSVYRFVQFQPDDNNSSRQASLASDADSSGQTR